MERNIIKWHFLNDREGKPVRAMRGWDAREQMRFELSYSPDGWELVAVLTGVNVTTDEPYYNHIKTGELMECMIFAEEWADKRWLAISEEEYI